MAPGFGVLITRRCSLIVWPVVMPSVQAECWGGVEGECSHSSVSHVVPNKTAGFNPRPDQIQCKYLLQVTPPNTLSVSSFYTHNAIHVRLPRPNLYHQPSAHTAANCEVTTQTVFLWPHTQLNNLFSDHLRELKIHLLQFFLIFKFMSLTWVIHKL